MRTFNTMAVTDVAANNPAALMKLLEANAEIGPSPFRMATGNELYLSYCADNRRLTPALVRCQIDSLMDAAVKTRELWDANAAPATSKK